MYGLLVFPDGKTITGQALEQFDDDSGSTALTSAQLAEYVEQGCVFLPCAGNYVGEWGNQCIHGNYWSSTEDGDYSAYDLYVYSDGYLSVSDDDNTGSHFTARLVKPTTPPASSGE